MITHIVATDLNGAIGRNNELPWRCKEDLLHFKSLTLNTVCLLGTVTYLGLPGKLKGRHLVVIGSRDIGTLPSHVKQVTTIDEALVLAEKINLEHYGGKSNINIIGGAKIYETTKDLVEEVHLSIINTVTENADAFYHGPEIKTTVYQFNL